ncbi:MAG: hypothetical protein JOZ78_01075 [Chroococcidiopsidaceae cyanobacterium CP_BM_ER_R8_30]|nr:hypothetical protein [Chroococcidiopsidaceae cyanobacterium CP_BM_ER_R8_30]
MQQAISTLGQRLRKSIFNLGLVCLICLSSIFIFIATPAHATTVEELKLTPPDQIPTSEEKIERAYEFGEGAGLLEEAKQESGKASRLTNPKGKANIKNVKSAEEADRQSRLGDKARKLVEKVAK